MSEIKLYNRDNLEAMREMPDKCFDLAIVDPPYMNDTKNLDNYLNKMRGHGYSLTTLNGAPDKPYFDELFRVSKNQIIWGGNYFPEIWGFGCRGFVFWYKQNPVKNFADGELAWTSFDRNAACFDYRYYGSLEGKGVTTEKIHPTQKPVKLYEWLLSNYAKQGDKVLDTHLGSGSIAIACHNLGFDLTAFEIDKEYFEAASRRLAKHQAAPTLFELKIEPTVTQESLFDE